MDSTVCWVAGDAAGRATLSEDLMDELPDPSQAGPIWGPPPPGASATSPPSPPAVAPTPASPVVLPSGPPSPWAAGGSGAAPVPIAWLSGEQPYVAVAAPSAPRRRRLVAAVVAAALVAGGLATTVIVRQQRAAAHASPDDAVRQFLGAIEKRDVLGAADVLAPTERTLLLDLLADWREAKMTGVPSDGDLHALDTYTLRIDGLTTTTEPVTPDIAVVALTGGRYEATASIARLPFGLSSLAGGSGGRGSDGSDGRGSDAPANAAADPTARGDLADRDPLRLATVRDGGGWHVSLLYTVAEAARRSGDLPAPDPATRIAARGADSPEEAVRQMVGAGAVGNWRRMIELTSPTEMAVLHDYGALLLGEAPLPPSEPWFTITRLELTRKQSRNATSLVVTALTASATTEGETTSLSVEQTSPGCWHVAAAVPGQRPVDQSGCAADGFGKLGESMTPAQRQQLAKLQDVAGSIGGIVTQQIDGTWYVSPLRTVGRWVPVGVTLIGLAGRGFGLVPVVTTQCDTGTTTTPRCTGLVD